MITGIEPLLEDQRNIVELQLAIKKLKFQRANIFKFAQKNDSDATITFEPLLEDQRNIVELQLAIKKIKFQRTEKPSVKVF